MLFHDTAVADIYQQVYAALLPLMLAERPIGWRLVPSKKSKSKAVPLHAMEALGG
jgi:hypothetical protein